MGFCGFLSERMLMPVKGKCGLMRLADSGMERMQMLDLFASSSYSSQISSSMNKLKTFFISGKGFKVLFVMCIEKMEESIWHVFL